jgi:quercetin dioxygenase-like cupin family protein
MINQNQTALGPHIRAAQVLLPCPDLAAELEFFTTRLGFRVDVIFPADAPSTAVISGHGTSLRLVAQPHPSAPAAQAEPLVLHLLCDMAALAAAGTPQQLTTPGGARIVLTDCNTPMSLPAGVQQFILSRSAAADAWHTGRAGLEYRDLIPGRLGGRFVASQIRVPFGGEVPDYVHFHKVRFQMIYCKTGWVRVVYEDQGPPFVLHAGDCVLQPPEIRHRVLEASEGMEVIEIGCPAIHETIADHKLLLPTGQVLPERLFGPQPGAQRFVRHIAASAEWRPWRLAGLQARDIGIAAATDGLAGVQVIRPLADSPPHQAAADTHQGEFLFWFVLEGTLELNSPQLGQHHLSTGDSCVIPSGTDYTLQAGATLELLEVSLAAR